MSALRYTSDLSDLVDGALQVVNMVQLFAHQERLSPKLKYEIARNSMMLVVFMEAQELKSKGGRENFLTRWAKRISDFKSYQAYIDYVKSSTGYSDVEKFRSVLEQLIKKYREDTKSEDDAPSSN